MTDTRTYTKVARAETEERTRRALLDAAEDAFFSRPWDQITLEAIAATAGVTKQTLLRHFGSKEGLFEQSYTRSFERVRAQRMAAPPATSKPPSRTCSTTMTSTAITL